MTQSKPSKSARKREQLELQQLGEQLLDFSVEELNALPIDERLREAALAASTMRAHGALRRQKQLIGKLMRSCDPEPVRRAVAARAASDGRAKRVFADAERWRDRIVAEGSDAVRSFCDQSGASAAALDELLASIRSAPSDRVEKSLRRRLFREVHDALIAAAVLVAADARGIPSHGVARLGRYVRGLRSGLMLPSVLAMTVASPLVGKSIYSVGSKRIVQGGLALVFIQLRAKIVDRLRLGDTCHFESREPDG